METPQPAGYLWLVKHLRLRVPRLLEEIRVGGGTRQELFEDGIRRRCFPARLAKPPEPNAQLAFALKHEASTSPSCTRCSRQRPRSSSRT